MLRWQLEQQNLDRSETVSAPWDWFPHTDLAGWGPGTREEGTRGCWGGIPPQAGAGQVPGDRGVTRGQRRGLADPAQPGRTRCDGGAQPVAALSTSPTASESPTVGEAAALRLPWPPPFGNPRLSSRFPAPDADSGPRSLALSILGPGVPRAEREPGPKT